MQAFVNLLAVTSFIVSGAVVGAGAYVYVNKDALLEQAKEYALSQLPIPDVGGITGGLFGGETTEEAPETTAIPIPTLPF